MALKLNVKKTIDFVINDDEKGFSYYVKFRETASEKTIAISDDDDTYYQYPVNVISSIIDSLREEKLIESPYKEEEITPDFRETGLPIPQIDNFSILNNQKKVIIGKMPEQTQYTMPLVFEPANVSPVQSFSGEEHRYIQEENAEEVQIAPGANTVVERQALAPVGETPPELKEDADKMMKERAEALANAKLKGQKPGFKRAHKEDELL